MWRRVAYVLLALFIANQLVIGAWLLWMGQPERAGRYFGLGLVLAGVWAWRWYRKEPRSVAQPDCPMCQSRSRCPVHS